MTEKPGREQPAAGPSRTRVDGPLKVTGRAIYSGDKAVPGMLHAALVQSTIARGRVVTIHTAAAEQCTGVRAVYTHSSLPRLQAPPKSFTDDFPAERRAPFSDTEIHYAGQHLAIVLAETLEAAQEASALIEVEYAEESPMLALREGDPQSYQPDHFATNSEERLQSERGAPGALAFDVRLEYNTPVEHHNPMEPSSTLALWEENHLTLYDSTRWVQGSRRIVAHMLAVPEDKVQVIAPFVGGAFGSKGFLWQHVAITAQAARACGRPVRLVLSRAQMFTSVGHRARTKQNLYLRTDDAGLLTSVTHETLSETSPVAHFVEPAGMSARNLYHTPHAIISHTVVPTNLATPCFMRAPGEAPGMFALECAMDEMAERCAVDPLAFRLKNYTEQDEQMERPWSGKHLRECYEEGAKRFGWAQRIAAPRCMPRAGVHGEKLVGWGMATAAYPGRRSPATVRAVIGRDGVAIFSTATHEIGGGTATVMAQVAAEACGLAFERVRFVLGDSAFPQAPVAGASQTTTSVGPAVAAAGQKLRSALVRAAIQDARSALHGSAFEDVVLEGGMMTHRKDAAKREPIGSVLARMPEEQISVEESAKLDDAVKQQYTFQSFGAHFVEVEVGVDIPEVKIRRWVSVIDAGRILNPLTARSQIVGGIIFGIGMALMERTIYDQRTGGPINANLADYLVPTSADIPELDISFIEHADYGLDPLGVRGVGEIGITGAPAAVANAVYHATGVRVRNLPITVERLMAASQ